MAVVSPFKAFHYSTQSITNLSDVITPPYDVIPAGKDKMYWDRSPYNFAHVDLPHSVSEDYSRAATTLKKWREHSIIVSDPRPAYYLYRQAFTIEHETHVRDTLMCAVLLSDFSEGIVRPHENTFGKYKADRLQLMRATQCQLSHIFGMVKDPQGFLETVYEKWEYQNPLLRAHSDEGVEHTVWRIDAAKAPEIAGFFEGKAIYIVDGHHRYESSLQYAREQMAVGQKDNPSAYMMFAIANSYDPGLVVFPTHRVINGVGAGKTKRESLEDVFKLAPYTYEDLKAFVSRPDPTPQFGLYLNGQLFLCTPRNWKSEESHMGKSVAKLAVAWSDHKLLEDYFGVDDSNRKEHIAYERDFESTWAQREKSDAIIFHAPPAIDDIINVADEEKFMPQKSTYFYPKLAAGLIMRDLTV